jgi:hypothetical protein
MKREKGIFSIESVDAVDEAIHIKNQKSPASSILLDLTQAPQKDGARHGLSTRTDQHAEMVSILPEEIFAHLAHTVSSAFN